MRTETDFLDLLADTAGSSVTAGNILENRQVENAGPPAAYQHHTRYSAPENFRKVTGELNATPQGGVVSGYLVVVDWRVLPERLRPR